MRDGQDAVLPGDLEGASLDAGDLDAGAGAVLGIGGVGDVFAAYDVEYWTRPGDPYAFAP